MHTTSVLVPPSPRARTNGKSAGPVLDLDYNQLLVESSPTGIVTYRASGEALSANPALAQMIGCTEEALRAQNFRQLESWKESGLLHAATLALESRSVRKIETQFMSSFGKRVHVSCKFVPFEQSGELYLLALFVDIAEQRRAEQVAAERVRLQGQLTNIAAAVPGIIFSFRLRPDGTTAMPYVSGLFQSVFDIAPESVRENAAALFRLIHPEDVESVQQSIVKSAAGLTPWHAEFRVRQKNGAVLWVEGNSTPQREADGSVLWHGLLQDITDRKHSEQALRASEQRFRELLENVELIAMTLDTNGRVTFCNDYLVKLTGWPREEIIGANWMERFIPGSRDDVKNLFFDNIERGTIPAHYENPIVTRNGEQRHVMWNNTILRDTAGNIIGTASIGEDITDRKRAEEALRASEEQFRQFAENIRGVFWMVDPVQDKVLYVSPAFETIWGRPCQSALESRYAWLEAVHAEDRPGIEEALQRKQTKGTYDETYRIVRPDGSLRWIHDRAFPLRNEQGIYRVVGIAEDITDQKQLEAEFRQAQKMESIGQLAGGVAHDFNNLLTVIQGHACLMTMDSELSESGREGAEQISMAAERAANLTRQLLTFSRRQVIQSRALNLNDVVAGVTKMLRRVVGEHISVEFQPSDVPNIIADAGMLEQVLMNLAVNARDAMARGGALVLRTGTAMADESVVSHDPEAIPGNAVWLSVADTGCGIPPENLTKIFEPFFTTKEIGKGTGLGLATVYGIVKQHGGRLKVQSEVGKGTTFTIYLPAAPDAKGGSSAPRADAVVRGGTETILLAEDEGDVRRLARSILESFGYQVIEAGSGGAALRKWEEHHARINMLLTDLMMPGGMTGQELADILRARRSDLKVAFLSGYTPELAGRDFPAGPGSHFLQKPFAPRSLAACVRACLDGDGPSHD